MKRKNNIDENERTRKKNNIFMYEARDNDEEEERKCMLGLIYDRYSDTIKKREVIRLYYV